MCIRRTTQLKKDIIPLWEWSAAAKSINRIIIIMRTINSIYIYTQYVVHAFNTSYQTHKNPSCGSDPADLYTIYAACVVDRFCSIVSAARAAQNRASYTTTTTNALCMLCTTKASLAVASNREEAFIYSFCCLRRSGCWFLE